MDWLEANEIFENALALFDLSLYSQSSQRCPVYGGTHTHVKPPRLFATHCPPFKHGF